jgi:hypothetical protein
LIYKTEKGTKMHLSFSHIFFSILFKIKKSNQILIQQFQKSLTGPRSLKIPLIQLKNLKSEILTKNRSNKWCLLANRYIQILNIELELLIFLLDNEEFSFYFLQGVGTNYICPSFCFKFWPRTIFLTRL